MKHHAQNRSLSQVVRAQDQEAAELNDEQLEGVAGGILIALLLPAVQSARAPVRPLRRLERRKLSLAPNVD